MDFRKEIKSIRQKNLMSQVDFAKVLGVAFTTVNRWECGKSRPTYRTLKLIDAFCKERSIDFNIENAFQETED